MNRRHRAPGVAVAFVAAAVTACGTNNNPDISSTSPVRTSPSSTLPATALTLVAYTAPCEPADDVKCSSEAAEFAGTVQVEAHCVLVDTYAGGPIETNPRSLVAVLFPYSVSWSAIDNGIVTSDGDIAHPGDWIYGGGGGTSLADLQLLDLTDQQRSDLELCAAASDDPEKFFEMGANDTITRLDGPPDL